MFLENFELKKGLTYTMSCYLKSNLNKNPFKGGAGNISSERAMFRMYCRKFMQGRLDIPQKELLLEINVDSPTDELKKYVSKPYKPQ